MKSPSSHRTYLLTHSKGKFDNQWPMPHSKALIGPTSRHSHSGVFWSPYYCFAHQHTARMKLREWKIIQRHLGWNEFTSVKCVLYLGRGVLAIASLTHSDDEHLCSKTTWVKATPYFQKLALWNLHCITVDLVSVLLLASCWWPLYPPRWCGRVINSFTV